MLEQLIEKFIEYLSQDDTRAAFEQKFLKPLTEYLGERFAWTLRAFQALAVLVAIQTMLLLFLIFRTYRHPACL